MKSSIFARFARAFFIFWHSEDVLVLSMTWNDLFCSCVDDVSIWWQMFNFVFLCPKRWYQFNSRIVRTRFSSKMTLNNWKMIPETRSYIFRRPSHFGRHHVCLSSLLNRFVQNTYAWVNTTHQYQYQSCKNSAMSHRNCHCCSRSRLLTIFRQFSLIIAIRDVKNM